MFKFPLWRNAKELSGFEVFIVLLLIVSHYFKRKFVKYPRNIFNKHKYGTQFVVASTKYSFLQLHERTHSALLKKEKEKREKLGRNNFSRLSVFVGKEKENYYFLFR